ncbi:hypothetical protein [Halobacillus sp. BBL2006]|uniref:hypothetical protein n=1 Tax=Halobacillus sp. BBL2006 TaxID=1543706 RepID=UPI00068D7DAF|nr:hypothetical protein [Halobacillus sp. BBL2006]
MSEFHIFSIVTVGVIVIASIILASRFHRTLHHSQKMVIAMATGTSLGLVIGLLGAAFYQDNLFLSLLISLSGGAILSGLCSFKLGVVSTLEGVTAGLMGGLMGAMLSEMVLPNQSLLFIQLLLTLAATSLLLYPVLTNLSSNHNQITSKKWFLKPFLILLLVAGYLIGGSLFDATPKHQPVDQHHHMG